MDKKIVDNNLSSDVSYDLSSYVKYSHSLFIFIFSYSILFLSIFSFSFLYSIGEAEEAVIEPDYLYILLVSVLLAIILTLFLVFVIYSYISKLNNYFLFSFRLEDNNIFKTASYIKHCINQYNVLIAHKNKLSSIKSKYDAFKHAADTLSDVSDNISLSDIKKYSSTVNSIYQIDTKLKLNETNLVKLSNYLDYCRSLKDNLSLKEHAHPIMFKDLKL